MSERKTVVRPCTAAGYRRTEEWLRSMSAQGWRLISAPVIGLFVFERAEPADVVWCITEARKEDDPRAIMAIAEDCGWRGCVSVFGCMYTWKCASECDAEELRTDDALRMPVNLNCAYRNAKALAVIGMLYLVPALIIPNSESSAWGIALAAIGSAFCALSLYTVAEIYCARNLRIGKLPN